ncbi:MAG: Mrp/NBP35 family ATP-binding protein [Flavobacteriales bacterium]|nr:Mrp/NBP35 family ATP-binding protein [Flavobacteriales bacterium]
MEDLIEQNVLDALRSVVDPISKKDVVEAGIVKVISISAAKVKLVLKATEPTMHAKERMKEACAFALERKFGKELSADISFEELSEDEKIAARKVLPGVKNIIAVASGKGGVGKSTIAVNLAVGLAKRGYKVGCIDADIYGPSMPLMLDVVQEKPTTVEKDGQVLMKPVENYGVKMLSIGFFADPAQAIVWRGPMASKALKQLFADTHWGELDFMVIDLPPGTGDIHLSVVQMVPLTGAVIVSTPQRVAMADARKGVEMFKLPNINVPVLGLVQNMAWFTPEELPENKYFIFGKDGAKNLAEEIDTPFLGDIPLVQSVRESGDIGRPAILQENTLVSNALEDMLDKFEVSLKNRKKNSSPTEKVEITRTQF